LLTVHDKTPYGSFYIKILLKDHLRVGLADTVDTGDAAVTGDAADTADPAINKT